MPKNPFPLRLPKWLPGHSKPQKNKGSFNTVKFRQPFILLSTAGMFQSLNRWEAAFDSRYGLTSFLISTPPCTGQLPAVQPASLSSGIEGSLLISVWFVPNFKKNHGCRYLKEGGEAVLRNTLTYVKKRTEREAKQTPPNGSKAS